MLEHARQHHFSEVGILMQTDIVYYNATRINVHQVHTALMLVESTECGHILQNVYSFTFISFDTNFILFTMFL